MNVALRELLYVPTAIATARWRRTGIHSYRNDDREIEKSGNKLLTTFADSPDLVFLQAWGNIGDELIYAGTRQLLSGFSYREESIRDLQHVTGHTALIAGSGGWCKPFHAMPALLRMAEERFQSVIILPSTFDVSEATIADALRDTRALVFARELVSYRQIRSLCRADIAHDCAFFFEYDKYKRDGRGILNAFRTDAESQNAPVPDDNIDISVVCSSLDEWLRTIASYDVVHTDRAHVMIAAAMLGKQVEYRTSNYHKVPAIAQYALKAYPVARIPEFISPETATSDGEDVSPILRFAHFLAKRSAGARVVLMDDIGSLRASVAYTKDDIVVISDGILSLQQRPELIEPLNTLCQAVQKIILADDIDSFPDTKIAEAFLERHGLPVEFFGYVNALNKKAGAVALLSAGAPSPAVKAPEGFRVVALISSFNEEDVIGPAIEQLHQNGIDVYLIDNWSTDGTYQKAQSLLGRGLIGLERFPPSGPSATYNWEELLKRKEELCRELNADWFIHHDADEIHESPWNGVRLRDAIYCVDWQGYNAIEFTLLMFPPVDDAYQPGSSLAEHFRHCEFGTEAQGQFLLTRAWKATDSRAIISESGGHCVEFPGRKVYPYNFLLRHYPIRSQSHGEKKLFQERQQRWNYAERKRVWHVHYDGFVPGARFLKNPKSLIEFNADFYADYLVERLSGIGIVLPEIAQLETLRKRAGQREQVVQTLSDQVQTVSAQNRALSARVQKLLTRVQTLSAELATVKSGKAWKIALIFRRIQLRVVPPDSRRAKMLQRLGKLLGW